MCGTCGCNDTENGVTYRRPDENRESRHQAMDDGEIHSHQHHHDIDHDIAHSHEHAGHSHHHDHHDHSHDSHEHQHHHHGDHHYPGRGEHVPEEIAEYDDAAAVKRREIRLEQDILAQNNRNGERNRGYFDAKKISALNMISSPGAGKTTLLEKTISSLKDEISFYVIEGDQQSMNDADRINATGVPVLQINTGSGCHLDASMVYNAVKQLEPAENSLLLIENVGNLVCPALFDLGEGYRIVMISVTEGDDKPVKYPTIFRNADICIINKIDLLPYVTFDTEKARSYAQRINPDLQFFEISATTGEGMERWYDWLKTIQW